MSINQCQSGIDDAQDIPSELFEQERVKLGRKGIDQSNEWVFRIMMSSHSIRREREIMNRCIGFLKNMHG
jgi:hypothetical protein